MSEGLAIKDKYDVMWIVSIISGVVITIFGFTQKPEIGIIMSVLSIPVFLFGFFISRTRTPQTEKGKRS